MRRNLFFISFLLLFSVFAAAAQQSERPAWDGVSRFTVLIMGLDRRPSESPTLSYRTDAIMLASFDPQRQHIGVLSIPRDTFFALPDTGELVRLNTLLVRGEARQEGAGPLLAVNTLQYNLGMYIDAYLVFDFEAFTTLIDAVGGVQVEVNYAIIDETFPDMNYGYDPLRLRPGVYTFNGRDALRYARTRHGDNDYLRVQRQLQVVSSLRDRLMSPGVLPGLLPQAEALMKRLDGHIYTDLHVEEALRLARAMLSVQPENLTMGALNEQYSIPYGTLEGTVRTADRSKLAELLVAVFGDNYAG